MLSLTFRVSQSTTNQLWLGENVITIRIPSSEGLRRLTFPPNVDTSSHDIAAVLYNPGLSAAVSYDRGVGFFSSAWLRRVAIGLTPFAERGGKMRLITSPILQAGDWAAIQQGEEARKNPVLIEALRVELNDLFQFAQERPVQLLAWMVADELLEIRLALPKPCCMDHPEGCLIIVFFNTGDNLDAT